MNTTKTQKGEELMAELMREQSFQFDFLLQLWVFLAFLSGVSAVFSAFIYQYVLSILNACVFFGAFLCFVAGAFRYYVLVIVLLLYSAGALILEMYFVVSLMTDFYICESDSCFGWRLILYDLNYWCVILLWVVLYLVTKQSWIILEDHNLISKQRVEIELEKLRRAENQEEEDEAKEKKS